MLEGIAPHAGGEELSESLSFTAVTFSHCLHYLLILILLLTAFLFSSSRALSAQLFWMRYQWISQTVCWWNPSSSLPTTYLRAFRASSWRKKLSRWETRTTRWKIGTTSSFHLRTMWMWHNLWCHQVHSSFQVPQENQVHWHFDFLQWRWWHHEREVPVVACWPVWSPCGRHQEGLPHHQGHQDDVDSLLAFLCVSAPLYLLFQ